MCLLMTGIRNCSAPPIKYSHPQNNNNSNWSRIKSSLWTSLLPISRKFRQQRSILNYTMMIQSAKSSMWKIPREKWPTSFNKYIVFKRSKWELLLMTRDSKDTTRASLVAQWIRFRLPMRGTRVRALGGEDPTYRGATKPVRHNYWGFTLEPTSHNYWSPHATTTDACTPRAHAPQQEKPL